MASPLHQPSDSHRSSRRKSEKARSGPPVTFSCPQCGLSFSRKEFVERHRKSKHDKLRPFACNDCGSSFARSDLLFRHRRKCASSNKVSDALGFHGPDGQLPPTVHAPDQELVSPSAKFSSATYGDFDFNAQNGASSSSLLASTSSSSLASIPMLSADEQLISSFLGEFFRSPELAPTHEYLPSYSPGTSPFDGGALEQSYRSQSTIGQTSELMNTFETTDGNLELSLDSFPQAMAVAEYIEKNESGDITTAGYSFFTTPSNLYPPHLFQPQIHANTRFFIPMERFRHGYLLPWNIPPLDDLSHYASLASTSFLPSIPVVHNGTLCLSDLPPHTVFALSVTGAAYEREGQAGRSFSDDMLTKKRVFNVRNFNNKLNSEVDRFGSLQSMLLYQLLGFFHRDEDQRSLAYSFHGALVMMIRQFGLLTRIAKAQFVPPPPDLRGIELETTWKYWVRIETWRRVAFITYLLDLEVATQFHAPPLLTFAEFNVDLPASDALWNADSAATWLRLMTSSPQQSLSFFAAVQALLAPSYPAPSSQVSKTLAQVQQLSSFPSVILSRTLSFQQAKVESAMRQYDPFQSCFGEFESLRGTKQRSDDILQRIAEGREMLKRVPGNLRGGRGWYEAIVPTMVPNGHPPQP
ncbi:hypothetical protein PILCRDRAFT_819307 [Piloderma croceum F 1598]|uniref:C2H2-type domain-containing protein n=1 Tax=Piloderma croceum (strain F 1598) TaxID=765440 RepID=A0A0C3C2B7_PILCF|nr:hypothetical protein PILCRDRAFT_819307 [Piloderma croceum F 1598]